MSRLDTYFKSATIRRYVRVGAVVVFVLALAVFLFHLIFVAPAPVAEAPTSLGDVTESRSAYTLSPALPRTLRIPSLGIETQFEEPLGLAQDQTIEIPESYEQVGWYKHSPTPGELGPSVILGHVDSYEGPAVFFSLGQLVPGERIYITRDDGSDAVFEVTALRRYEQSGFPSELVYGDIDHAGLRLVTCSGTYDRGEARYTHNLVVYAALVEPDAPLSEMPDTSSTTDMQNTDDPSTTENASSTEIDD